MPCQVVYADVAPARRPSPLFVRPDGTVGNPPDAPHSNPAIGDVPGAQLARRAARRDQLPAAAEPHRHEAASAGELQKIHRLLRGRYAVASLLALLLAGAGGFAGFKLGYKTFQSQGLITISRLDLFPKADSQESTDQFMDAQAAQLKGQRVLYMALGDERWLALAKDRSDADIASLVKELDVTPRGQLLVVKFTDRQPQAASTAVLCIMDAFIKVFDEEQTKNGAFSADQMTNARNEFRNRLLQIQQQMEEIAAPYDPDALEVQRTIKLQEQHDYQKAIADVEQAQAEAVATGRTGGAATRPSGPVSEDEVARFDPSMKALIDKREQARQEIGIMQANALMPEHPRLKAAQLMLDALEREIADKLARSKAGPDPAALSGPGTLASLSPEQLQRRLTYLKVNAKALDEALATLSGNIQKINKLRIQRDPVQSDLTVAEQWLQKDQLQKTAWRAQHTDPDRPLAPFRDTRITFAGAGGVGGLALGVGLVLLFGLADRTVRHPQDASGRSDAGPILGMLPQLPDDLADPEQAAIAAHGVHEIRTLLQIWGRAQNHQVFAVTSSAAGSGKTSLITALGISFASAKFRTLMIDCDLVAGGLTRRVDAIIRRKIGQILTRAGYITEAQLAEALRLSRSAGRRLGETLVQLGYVTVQELDVAMATQADQSVGLLEALEGEDLRACTTDAGIEGLSILPLGTATGLHAGAIAPDALLQVIEQAREAYDIVLVDTGPVPGSLEASLIVSNVDAVVLAVARGDRKPDVDRAVAHLHSLGARLAGFVFNRARVGDVKRYGSSRYSPAGQPVAPPPRVRSSQLGPVAQAVASYAPAGLTMASTP
jgi:Mrp family chromosome partitioning ATPase